MGTGRVAPPRTPDCWARINCPHRLCRLKNYELLKFCNINDCSHLLIWQPATSPFLTLLTPVIKTEYFWFGRQLEKRDRFVSWGSWVRTCIPLRIAGGEDKGAGGDKVCTSQGCCLGVRDGTSKEPPAPPPSPRGSAGSALSTSC